MSIVELRQQVCPADGKARLRFVTKIFRVLAYTREHPDEISQIGAAWCADGVHFVANSSILAAFLNLKPNSINTNFRDHGFQIVGKGEVGRDVPLGTADAAHWKKRHNKEAHFCIDANEQTLNAINSIQDKILRPEPSTPAQFSFMPRATAELLHMDAKQQLSLANMVFSLQGNATSEWFYRVLDKATALWTGAIGASGSTAPLERVTNALFKDVAMEESELRQLVLNFEFLIQQRDDSSQLQEAIPFDSFVKFMVRYGWVHGMADLLMEVSHFASSHLGAIPGLSEFDSQSADEKVQFKSWFFPSSDRPTAVRWLDGHVCECWVVIPSKTPNYFTLLYKEEGSKNVEALHMIYDCMAAEREKRFAVMFKDGSFAYKGSLIAMLTETLGLTIRETEAVTQENPPREVAPDDFVKRKTAVEESQDPPSEFSLRPSFLQSDSQFWVSQHDTQNYGFDSQMFS